MTKPPSLQIPIRRLPQPYTTTRKSASTNPLASTLLPSPRNRGLERERRMYGLVIGIVSLSWFVGNAWLWFWWGNRWSFGDFNELNWIRGSLISRWMDALISFMPRNTLGLFGLFSWLNATRDNNRVDKFTNQQFLTLLIPCLLPIISFFTLFNWLGMKYFRHGKSN